MQLLSLMLHGFVLSEAQTMGWSLTLSTWLCYYLIFPCVKCAILCLLFPFFQSVVLVHLEGECPAIQPAIALPSRHAKRQRCWTTSLSVLTVLAWRRGKLPRLASVWNTEDNMIHAKRVYFPFFFVHSNAYTCLLLRGKVQRWGNLVILIYNFFFFFFFTITSTQYGQNVPSSMCCFIPR